MKDKTYQLVIKAVGLIILVLSIAVCLYIAANRNAGHNLPLSDWEKTLKLDNILFTVITLGIFIGVNYLYQKRKSKRSSNKHNKSLNNGRH
jgi:hypothetical protein